MDRRNFLDVAIGGSLGILFLKALETYTESTKKPRQEFVGRGFIPRTTGMSIKPLKSRLNYFDPYESKFIKIDSSHIALNDVIAISNLEYGTDNNSHTWYFCGNKKGFNLGKNGPQHPVWEVFESSTNMNHIWEITKNRSLGIPFLRVQKTCLIDINFFVLKFIGQSNMDAKQISPFSHACFTMHLLIENLLSGIPLQAQKYGFLKLIKKVERLCSQPIEARYTFLKKLEDLKNPQRASLFYQYQNTFNRTWKEDLK